ncbi:ABC transporter substrate-binding protein [Halapricum desulfuricans]|uniref:ABC-type sugar transport system, periplasmic component n=1 Tax=Halapricum desulfuricans TaxID=2841257 RepID=A0A897NC46_9EURY|nr:extracellular solute-binding protein [Halapricum desulfuricans]QSG10257.1 ABC-type sugar transport system, periplasmic component [Halapricum desulfuricans]
MASTLALAGCATQSGSPTTEPEQSELPTREDGIEQWGQKLNEHARKAGIDWEMFAGEGIELKFGMGLHKYSTTTKPLLPYFEELTGISVEYEIFEENRYWREARNAMADQSGEYDGFMVGLWPAGGYHQGTDGDPWVEDLWPYIEDATLTDQDWLAMEDFMDQTIELMTFPDPDGGDSFIGFPNGIEIYGCVGYDMETYDTLGLEEPTTFEELEQNAKAISESSEVDQEGMVSRTASATLSSANWGTMFRSHGAKWIDREVLLNEDDPDPEAVALINSDRGVESLERFGSILHNYGPSQAWTMDWYANNQTYNRGDVGMIYSTPQTSGIVDEERMANTKWIPPLRTEDGRERIGDTWIWATGISSYTDEQSQKAAWLFIQWANSRAANFLLSTHQWQGDEPRAGHARFNMYRDDSGSEWRYEADAYPEVAGAYPEVAGEGYEQTFIDGMKLVPTSPPPVPVDTPQNMNIMDEAATAMSRVVANGPDTARDELDAIASSVGEYAKRIPDRYINYVA